MSFLPYVCYQAAALALARSSSVCCIALWLRLNTALLVLVVSVCRVFAECQTLIDWLVAHKDVAEFNRLLQVRQ